MLSVTGKKVAVALLNIILDYYYYVFPAMISVFWLVLLFPKVSVLYPNTGNFCIKFALLWSLSSDFSTDPARRWVHKTSVKQSGRLCIFNAVQNGKEAGGVSEVPFFLFPLFPLPGEGTVNPGPPALCFPPSCCSAVSALMQDWVLCVPASPGVWVAGNWVWLGSLGRRLVCRGGWVCPCCLL